MPLWSEIQAIITRYDKEKNPFEKFFDMWPDYISSLSAQLKCHSTQNRIASQDRFSLLELSLRAQVKNPDALSARLAKDVILLCVNSKDQEAAALWEKLYKHHWVSYPLFEWLVSRRFKITQVFATVVLNTQKQDARETLKAYMQFPEWQQGPSARRLALVSMACHNSARVTHLPTVTELSKLYCEGLQSIPKDMKLALWYAKRAQDLGDQQALRAIDAAVSEGGRAVDQYALALFYKKQNRASLEQWLPWLLKAADQDHRGAQQLLEPKRLNAVACSYLAEYYQKQDTSQALKNAATYQIHAILKTPKDTIFPAIDLSEQYQTDSSVPLSDRQRQQSIASLIGKAFQADGPLLQLLPLLSARLIAENDEPIREAITQKPPSHARYATPSYHFQTKPPAPPADDARSTQLTQDAQLISCTWT